MSSVQRIKIFSGSGHLPLAREICTHLGVSLGEARLIRFSDGENFVEVGENVRGADVFVLQPTSTPANERLMELLIMVDALKRASARSICAILPYFGYARQDRKSAPRTPITAKLVSDLIEASGVTRVLSLDLHAAQIQGFFSIPFDHLFARPVFLRDIMQRFADLRDVVIVSPDAGGVERARAYAKRLDCGLAIIDKRRSAPNQAEVMHLVGSVAGKAAILVDDMVDTAGTLSEAASALMAHGAKRVLAYASHPVLSGPALDRLEASPLEVLVVSNSIPLTPAAAASRKVEALSIAPLLAEAVRRIQVGESVSSLLNEGECSPRQI